MSKKMNSRAFAQKKRNRRKWLTFMRMIRYGVNNFSRNAWLTVAATAVMTITLLIIFVTFVAGNILNDSIAEMTRKIDMSIYVKTDTKENDIKSMKKKLETLSNVESVAFISPSEGRKDLARQNKSDDTALSAITEATNKIPGVFRITLKDIEDTSQLEAFVKDDRLYRANQERKPTFVTRKDTLSTLANWANFAQKAGIAASVVFVLISSLIIFNTIRMAIFSRKDEIEMMKLIGADRSFIRGPFVVEASVYGFIAGVFATGLGILLIYLMRDGLANFGVMVDPTLDLLMTFAALVVVVMVVLGGLIGTISSLFATRRYLKL